MTNDIFFPLAVQIDVSGRVGAQGEVFLGGLVVGRFQLSCWQTSNLGGFDQRDDYWEKATTERFNLGDEKSKERETNGLLNRAIANSSNSSNVTSSTGGRL